MMACSYLNAGVLKSETAGAACWSPPAMAGCPAADTRPAPMALPTPAMIQPTPSRPLPSGTIGLPTGSTGLPSGSIALPRAPMPLASGQLGLSSGPVGILNQTMGLSSELMELPSASRLHSGQSGGSSRPVVPPTGPMLEPNPQLGLQPPFARPMPLDLHSALSHTGPSVAEPALDLSTSASMTSSLKSRLPSPDEDRE